MSNEEEVRRTRFYTAPSIYLVGRQQVNVPELDLFLSEAGSPLWDTDTHRAGESLVETAGRLSYMSFAKPRPGGNKAYIGHILEVGHGSVLEHAVFNMIFTGVSRSLTHELIRHRAGMSYSQLSQRFVDESNVGFVVPPAMMPLYIQYRDWIENGRDACSEEEMRLFRRCQYWIEQRLEDIEEYEYWANHLETSSQETDKTLRRKQAREAARSVLPNCAETKIFVTANARAWRHFLEMRGDAGADREIRRLAVAVLNVFQEESPNLFGDYAIVVEDESTGEIITTPHRKV